MGRILNLDGYPCANTIRLLNLFERVVMHQRREHNGDGGFFSLDELDKHYGVLLLALTTVREPEIAEKAKNLFRTLDNRSNDWAACEGYLLQQNYIPAEKGKWKSS